MDSEEWSSTEEKLKRIMDCFSRRTSKVMPAAEPKYSAECIAQRVKRIAAKMERDYDLSQLVLVGLMDGAIYLLTDLLRELHTYESGSNVQVTTANVKSGAREDPPICKWLPPKCQIQYRDVVIVDDIVSTGKATTFLKKKLQCMRAKSVKVCSMLYQYDPRTGQSKVAVEYFGFKVPHPCWLGYGLDYKGNYRNLPGIHEYEQLQLLRHRTSLEV